MLNIFKTLAYWIWVTQRTFWEGTEIRTSLEEVYCPNADGTMNTNTPLSAATLCGLKHMKQYLKKKRKSIHSTSRALLFLGIHWGHATTNLVWLNIFSFSLFKLPDVWPVWRKMEKFFLFAFTHVKSLKLLKSCGRPSPLVLCPS